MPMDDTLELSPEEAKQAKQRLKEEKKKLKKNKRNNARRLRPEQKKLQVKRPAFQRKTKVEAVLFCRYICNCSGVDWHFMPGGET